MPRQAPFTKRTEIGVQKGQKMCKTMQNVHKQKKHFFGCPGKLHLQNAQKLECEEHKKCAKPRKMCANQKRNTFLDAQASSTYKTHRNWSAKSKKNICKTMQNVHKSKKTFLDAQASSTYKTHRNWSAKSTKMCTKKSLVWMPRQAPLTKRTELGV